ncbi:hypothetical protein [Pseudonocardia sp. KRD291]|uniref:hypothetical protein n=1 Tax=Pseudonocardia sp. KRD291 TaxID=2792007 RepID=UPI001C4A3B6D|nr:hypothetical protein [Pseudonocardia sp. KRD291]MBW0102332.1 hypothetical protein [Pseudonocardia sp. KRD291]
MTAPRQPRHRLADDLDAADVPYGAAPVEPLTQVLPIIPSQRAAVPQVFPPGGDTPAPPGGYMPAPPGGRGAAPSTGSWQAGAQRTAARRGPVPLVLAAVTAAVLALGVGVVVVESGPAADAAPASGE